MKYVALFLATLAVCLTIAITFRYELSDQHPDLRLDRWTGRVEIVDIDEQPRDLFKEFNGQLDAPER